MFGKTRKELFEARVALAKAEASLELLVPANDSLKRRVAELEGIRTKAEHALDEKMAVTAAALERAQALEIKNAVLTERLDLVSNYFPGGTAAPTGERGHLTEEEEDLHHALAAGLITKPDLEAALEAAGLANTEVDLAFTAADYPRLGS